jgi:hypothetical protein
MKERPVGVRKVISMAVAKMERLRAEKAEKEKQQLEEEKWKAEREMSVMWLKIDEMETQSEKGLDHIPANVSTLAIRSLFPCFPHNT